MMQITVTTEGVEEVNRLLDTMPAWMFTGARNALADYVFQVDEQVKQNISDGTTLHTRSGTLVRSFQDEVHGDKLGNLGASVSSDAVYAPIQELGGTVRPIDKYLWLAGGPYLNIPAQANLTDAGRTRLTAKMVFDAGGRVVPINAPKARYALILNGVAMYWLVKEVTIPPRLKFEETATQGIPTLLSTLADLMMQEGQRA